MAMIRRLFLKEILLNLYSFRFHIMLVVTLAMFTICGLLYVNISGVRLADLVERQNKLTAGLHESSAHLNSLAGFRQHLVRMPEPGEVISLAGEKELPDLIYFDAFILGGFSSEEQMFSDIDRYNYKLNSYIPFDWVFIAGIIMSFFILVLTFDAFSGEKQNGTLRLQCAYPVSRLEIFVAKYLAYTVLVCLTFLLGISICLITVSLASSFEIAVPSPGQILATILAAMAYFSFYILAGLWLSSIAGKPATSLSYSLFTWIMLVIFIPSGMAMLGEKICSIPSAYEHTQQMYAVQSEIWDNAPQRAHSYGPPRAWGGKVYPYMDLRKATIDEMDASRNEYKVKRFNDQLRQVKMAHNLGRISPYMVFRSVSEKIACNGLRDFESDFHRVVNYRGIFREYIESKDREDPESFHFVNSWHPETYSSAPVKLEEVPVLTESRKELVEVLGYSVRDILLLILFNLIVLAGGWIGFLRYDVR